MIICVRLRDGAALPDLLGVARDLSPVVQALPPDTALVDVAGAERYFGQDAAGIASVLRVRALAYAGADCALGVAATPLLARMAARQAAYGATVTVAEGPREPAAFLAPKPVTALPGVGTATARTLRAYGLGTVGKAAGVPLATLQRLLGVRAGREVYEKAHGIDRTKVVPDAGSHSIAAERSFPHDELDPGAHHRALLSAAGELGARLRDHDQACRSLTLVVRYADGSATVRTRTLPEATAHSPDLTATAYRMLDALGLQRARVRAFSLRAEALVAADRVTRQLTFDPADDRSRRLEETADRVRARFGPSAIGPGALAA
ncbi:DinB/UmuC family translesion DNA polymerase [Streptomyces sp. DW26H14]|uniref:DinB/UmuC family translesion DNA polymerase n=1 Tax=Streptomyces sp. DW26H14 TaxID=3435395 RepID=UPI00403D748B